MSNINPITSPRITSYQQIALPLAVASLNPTADKWIFSNYIQVSCVNREHYLTCCNEDNSLHYSFYNPEITFPEPADHICIQGGEQLFMFDNFKYIKWIIDEGWYIYTDADMYFINGSDAFNSYHYSHDMLIYGYDDDDLLIYMYGNSKLEKHIVSINNFKKGYFSKYCKEDVYRNRAILFKDNEKEFDYNIEKIRWHMHDYLNGTETFARERPNGFNPDSFTMQGVNTYDEFISLLDYAIEGQDKVLRKSDLYCFYEHKEVMFDRVNALKDDDVLEADDDLITRFENIKNMAQTFLLSGLKVARMRSVENKNATLIHMKSLLNDIKLAEISAWTDYISENKELLG